MRILSVTSVRNEGPFVIEWIAHMRLLGVTDFLMFSNDCSDGTDTLLNQLQTQGVITHIPQTMTGTESPQWRALKTAWDHPLRKECDWAIVSDVDEFMMISTGAGRFHDLIAACPDDTDAIALPWRLFGNAGIAMFKDAPVSGQFTQAIEPQQFYPVGSTFFKTLFRLDGPFNQFGIHRPKHKNPTKHRHPNWVGGAGKPLSQHIAENPDRMSRIGDAQGMDLVQCNHYSLRSAESFLVKALRGLPNRRKKQIDLSYWINRNFNHVVDDRMLAQQSELVAEMEVLKSYDGIKELHDLCVAAHRAAIAQALGQEHMFRLYSDILMAMGSRTIPAATARALLKIYQNTQQ